MNRYVWSWTEKQTEKNGKAIIKLEEKVRKISSTLDKLDSELRSYLEDTISELTAIPQEWVLDPDSECHIYFIRCLDTVKIGYSKNPHQRLSALQTANPHQLELLYSFPSLQYTESQIHQELNEHHIKLEWIKYNDEVKEFIKDIKNGKKQY